MIYEEEKNALNRYAEERFGHTDVPYRSILKALLHDVDVEVDVDSE